MVEFSFLKAIAVSRETTKEYTFTSIEGEPSIIVSPACDDNEDYLRARLDLALTEFDGEDPRKLAGKATVDSFITQYAESREMDRKLLAKACCRSWGTPGVDLDGKQVEFSEENIYAFLCQLPIYLFDPFRNFVQNVFNFAPRKKPTGDHLGKS